MARRETSLAGPGSRAFVVDLIRSSGPISRVELVEATGLTQPSISNIVRRLIDDGVVRETGATVATGGKPRALLVINSHAAYGIGVHLGVDTITCVATDTRGGAVGRLLVEGAGERHPEEVVDLVAGVVGDLVGGLGLARESLAGVAVVAPGQIRASANPVTGPPGLARWAGFPLAARLERAVGLPVLVDNDSAAAAIGEFWARQVSRERTFGCLYMGTGIGAGIVVDGALHRGASSNAGELGHITAVSGGIACYCGNHGCLERYAAPPALVARARAHPTLLADLDLASQDDARAFDALARAAVYGVQPARELLDESARLLADAAVSLVNLLDLDTLVLAGPGFAVAGSIYTAAVRERLGAAAFARATHGVDVDLSSNPRDSAAVGAAALVLQGSVAPGHGPQVGGLRG
ncbi:ROK family transcriptional regulator [Cellulomonas hominis]